MTARVTVRLTNRHPAHTGPKELCVFKQVTPAQAIRLLAASQLVLWGTSSMYGYEKLHDGKWLSFGPRGKGRVVAEATRLAALWSPMDDLR